MTTFANTNIIIYTVVILSEAEGSCHDLVIHQE